jgi:hypothetical protein
MTKNPKYYRVRHSLIVKLIGELDSNDPDRVLLRNGVFPEGIDEERLVKKHMQEHSFSNEPLSFLGQTLFNTWFEMHPEKVAGKQIITSSREFPISIKGTKEDIIRTIRGKQKDFSFLLEVKKRSAKAKLKLMNV